VTNLEKNVKYFWKCGDVLYICSAIGIDGNHKTNQMKRKYNPRPDYDLSPWFFIIACIIIFWIVGKIENY